MAAPDERLWPVGGTQAGRARQQLHQRPSVQQCRNRQTHRQLATFLPAPALVLLLLCVATGREKQKWVFFVLR